MPPATLRIFLHVAAALRRCLFVETPGLTICLEQLYRKLPRLLPDRNHRE